LSRLRRSVVLGDGVKAGFSKLTTLGLTNKDTGDLGSLIVNKIKMCSAYCTSAKCTEYFLPDKRRPGKFKKYYHPKVKKQVCDTRSTKERQCPDCGHVVIWMEIK